MLLVERLLETLSDDAVFAAELDRRYEEFRRDPSTAVPWSEISADE